MAGKKKDTLPEALLTQVAKGAVEASKLTGGPPELVESVAYSLDGRTRVSVFAYDGEIKGRTFEDGLIPLRSRKGTTTEILMPDGAIRTD